MYCITVKSRKITYLTNKSRGVFLLPLLESLNGTKVAECALRELAIVEGQIVPEGYVEFSGAV